MKESDRKFEKLLKEAVCSYHKEEMDALPSEEELQDIQLSDDFYRKMDGLVKKQKRRWQYRFVRYGAVAASFLLFTFGTVGAAAYALMGAENFKAFFKKTCKRIPCRRQCGDGSGTADRHGCDNRRYSLRGR